MPSVSTAPFSQREGEAGERGLWNQPKALAREVPSSEATVIPWDRGHLAVAA